MSRRRIVWDEDMVNALVELRYKGHSLETCCNKVGVSIGVAQRKARELNLTKRMSRGAISGVALMSGARK